VSRGTKYYRANEVRPGDVRDLDRMDEGFDLSVFAGILLITRAGYA
jgi:hypothetical protein